ncbi:MAG: acyl-CoA thioesterase II [Ectothiorhodospiraceae bacterium]|nr:acyl-CoA thioesterase II [Ectothiorhodospiraceae bacterium]
MDNLVERLMTLLDLERLEQNLFRGESRNIVGRRVFGGQVLGQALVAAGRTVETERRPHSLHAYFLRGGDTEAPIIYEVERARDGGSFSTRRVVAVQHGRPIFNLSASFQVDETGLEHQIPLPDVPPPESLETELDYLARHQDQMPPGSRKALEALKPIEIRPVDPEHPMKPKRKDPAIRHAWFRTTGKLPDDPLLHMALLAYASDFRLLGTALLPHGRTVYQGGIQMASLDHAMWFHRPVRMDDWLLYTMESPSASNARGFNLGHIYSRDGVLLASVTQEGLIRPVERARKPEPQEESLPQGG